MNVALVLVLLVVLLVSGVAWAFAAVLGGAVLDGVPADQYEPGNRFAFAVALLFLGVACPGLSVTGVFLTRHRKRSVLRSLAVAQAACAVVAVPTFLMLA